MKIKDFFNRLAWAVGLKSNRFLRTFFTPWELAQGRTTPGDYDRAVELYTSWVYKCAFINASSVAQVPLRLYLRRQAGRKTARINHIPVTSKTFDCYLRNDRVAPYIRKDIEIEEVEEHPFLDLMKNVNPQRNQFDADIETQLFQELTGNGYWYLVPSGLRGMSDRRIPAEIWTLPSHRVEIVPSRRTYVDHYELRQKGFGEPQRLEVDEVVHFRFPNPQDTLYGMGPLQGAMAAVNVNEYIKSYEINLLKNQARPDFIVKMESGTHLTDEQRERFRGTWDALYRGPTRAGKPGILEGGMDIKELGFSPKELSFLVGRKLTMQEIAGIFGVPMSKMTTEDVNLANAQIGEVQYAKDTIVPRLKLREQKLNERALPLYDDNLFCVYDNPVPEDREQKKNELCDYTKTGILMINEARQELGKGPADGGNYIYLPMNVMPIGGASEKRIQELSQRIAKRVREKLNAN
jgi:HK97 family phage portal protein